MNLRRVSHVTGPLSSVLSGALVLPVLMVLTVAIPAAAQEDDSPLGNDPDELPLEPETPPPSDDLLTPTESDVAPQATASAPTRKKTSGRESWKDIVVVPRKWFLKRHRVELMPYFGTTLNDNLIQHHAIGGEINFFVTDILSVGVAGHYYFKNVLDQEFYTRYHFRRVPAINRYIYTAVLNFAYVPIHGKFTLLNKTINQYEIFATAGVGISGTEIIPRDFRYPAFRNNTQLTFPVGIGGRLFLTRWLALHAAFRSYIMLDKFEPSTRTLDVSADKKNATGDIVNNMMFNVGFSFFLPPSFKYTTFR